MSLPPSRTWPALGSTATVAVTDPAQLDRAAGMLHEQLADLVSACSRFIPDSELARLEAASGRWVAVSPLLLDALAAGKWAARHSGGLVTPTLGASLRLVGYDRSIERLGPQPAPARFMPAPDWHGIELDPEGGRVRIPTGMRLDLGATAKAFAADRAARTIGEATGAGVLVSLGGDMRAWGPPPAGGWPVLVGDDHRDPGPDAQPIGLHDGGLATSSRATRSWLRAGRVQHHLLDPASGAPAGGPWRTVSVCAATCLAANAASTAAMLMGDRAPIWLAAHHLPARLVDGAGRVRRVATWPAEPVAA